jgi:histidinol-phosphatase (PHP family)
MWYNYHCHSDYCDGKGKIEDYVLAAIEKKFTSMGFSSHSPLPFRNMWSMDSAKLDDYFLEINSLKEKYANQIEIYAGLEMDFIREYNNFTFQTLNHAKSHLDYTIFSIHFLKSKKNNYLEIDGLTSNFIKRLREDWDFDSEALVTEYFQAFESMIDTFKPTIIGHFDKIKMHKYPNGELVINPHSSAYKNAWQKALKSIAQSGAFLEVNTRGIYKKELGEPYPSIEIIKAANELNIPLVISSDAHHPKELTSEFENIASLLNSVGIKKIKVLRENKWIDAELVAEGIFV